MFHNLGQPLPQSNPPLPRWWKRRFIPAGMGDVSAGRGAERQPANNLLNHLNKQCSFPSPGSRRPRMSNLLLPIRPVPSYLNRMESSPSPKWREHFLRSKSLHLSRQPLPAQRRLLLLLRLRRRRV